MERKHSKVVAVNFHYLVESIRTFGFGRYSGFMVWVGLLWIGMFEKWHWMAHKIVFVCILGNHTINNDISLKYQWPKPFIIVRIVSGEEGSGSGRARGKKGNEKYIEFIYYIGPAGVLVHFFQFSSSAASLRICHAKREIDKWYQSNLPTTYHHRRRLNIEIMLSGAPHNGTRARKEWMSKEGRRIYFIINWKSRNTH